MSHTAFEQNLGRSYAFRRVAKSILLNQILMKLIATRDLDAEPQLAIYSHDLIGQAVNVYGWWELEQLTLLRAFVLDRLGRGGAFIDVGANIGNHSVYLRELFDEVHAVEANPRTFALLQFNLERWHHMRAHHFAASDREGELAFVVEGVNVGASHVARPEEQDADKLAQTRVVAKRLDEALSNTAPVRLVKIDVEGHELSCLRGMAEILRTHKPMVVFEQHPHEFSNGTTAVIEELRSQGYRQFHAVVRRPSTARTGLWAQALSALWSLVFGFRMEAVRTERFEPAFYEMIIAQP